MHACVSMIPSSASRWSSSTGGLCSCLPKCTLAGVREAAEKGYDRLSWTTGDEQAERYDLSRHIGRVQYDPDANELTGYDPHGHQVIEEKVDPMSMNLPDTLAKNLLRSSLTRLTTMNLAQATTLCGRCIRRITTSMKYPARKTKTASLGMVCSTRAMVENQKKHSILKMRLKITSTIECASL